MSESNPWLQRWEERYNKPEYAYGKEPNVFLKDQLEQLTPGKILFLADGEGRNSVYAATQGWQASACDISPAGKEKALKLAEANGVEIDYRVGELPELGYEPNSFDAIALIYAHLPAEIRPKYHRLLSSYLKSGGTIIFEAFGKNHLTHREKNPAVGGPQLPELLFSIDEITSDFNDLDPKILREEVIELHEGLYHNGQGSVVRFVGKKSV